MVIRPIDWDDSDRDKDEQKKDTRSLTDVNKSIMNLLKPITNLIDHGNIADKGLSDASWSTLGMTTRDLNNVREIIAKTPFVGDFFDVILDRMGWTKTNALDAVDNGNGTIQIEGIDEISKYLDEIAKALNNQASVYSKQYNVPIGQIRTLRDTAQQLSGAIADLNKDYSAAQRRLNDINSHMTDYIQGVQKKAMRKAYDASLSENRRIEEGLATKQKELNSVDKKLGVISDLSVQPQNPTNDAKVKEAIADLGITVTTDTPSIYRETTSNDVE